MGDIATAEEAYAKLHLYSLLGVGYGRFLLATGQTLKSREFTERNLQICKEKKWTESVPYCETLLGEIAVLEKD